MANKDRNLSERVVQKDWNYEEKSQGNVHTHQVTMQVQQQQQQQQNQNQQEKK